MVEWKTIDDISSNVFAGGTPSTKHEDYYDGDIPWIRSGEIDFNTITKAERNITQKGYNNSSAKLIRKGSVVMAMTGATVAKSAIVDFETSANQSVCAIETNENIANYKFVYYSLAKDYFKIKSSAQGALTSLNLAMIKQIQIPIPSLSEQQRIVGILDTFTSSIDNMKEQIAQRRKQYEYYRDQLLDLEGKEGVEMKTLGEICEIKGRIGFRGYTREDQVAEGEGVISLSPGNIEEGKMKYNGCTYISWEKYYESPEIMAFNNDIIFCKTGSTVGKVAMIEKLPCEATINPQLVLLKNVAIDSKFLKYTLGTFRLQSIVKRLAGVGSVPNISQEKLNNLDILLPSLSEQHRIVSILDTFESSITNLESQLSQREKQYEYYRNKLLTFE